MGLAEKRAIAQLQENGFKKFKQEINAVTGKEIEVDMDWDGIMEYDKAVNIIENLVDKFAFQRIIEAMESVCKDDMGKQAVQEGLSKISVKANTTRNASNSKIELLSGVLTLVIGFDGNGLWDVKKIQKTIEDGL